MRWFNEVQNRILTEIQRQPTMRQRLVEALHWRGFLVWSETGHIYMDRCAAAADRCDIESLRPFKPLCIVAREEAADYCAEVRWRYATQPAMDAVIEGILRLPAPDGMTSILSHPEFGFDFPATELDQGVALLVRGLARLGLPTKISGHGHAERCRIFVEFANDAVGQTFRELFDARFADRVADAGVFTFGQGELGGAALMIGDATNDEETAFRFFCAAQQLGRLMFEHNPASGAQRAPALESLQPSYIAARPTPEEEKAHRLIIRSQLSH